MAAIWAYTRQTGWWRNTARRSPLWRRCTMKRSVDRGWFWRRNWPDGRRWWPTVWVWADGKYCGYEQMANSMSMSRCLPDMEHRKICKSPAYNLIILNSIKVKRETNLPEQNDGSYIIVQNLTVPEICWYRVFCYLCLFSHHSGPCNCSSQPIKMVTTEPPINWEWMKWLLPTSHDVRLGAARLMCRGLCSLLFRSSRKNIRVKPSTHWQHNNCRPYRGPRSN